VVYLGFTVQKVKQKDLEQISKIILENFKGKYYSHYPQEILNTYLYPNTPERLKATIKLPKTHMFVLKDGNKVCGCILIRFDKNKGKSGGYRIRRLHLSPEYCGQGLSDLLLEKVYSLVRKKGYNTIYCESTPEVAEPLKKRGWKGKYKDKVVEVKDDLGNTHVVAVPRFLAYKRI